MVRSALNCSAAFRLLVLGGVIVVVTAALWFTVIFVAAHLTSVRIRNKRQYLALSADSVNRPPSERPVHSTLIHNRGGARSPRSPAAEKINESYVGRVLRLTLLAPDIGLDGSRPM